MDSYEQVLHELHSYITTPADLAHYHRAMGYLCIERGNFEVAIAHLMTSLAFEKSTLPLGEIIYIKVEHGQDYTNMELTDSFEMLRRAGETIFADETTIAGLDQLLDVSFHHNDYETTVWTAVNLYGLMREEAYNKIAQELIKVIRACKE